MHIQPLQDYLLAEADKATEKTPSGLYIPERVKEKPHTASVIATGSMVDGITPSDVILYKNYSATEFKQDGKSYLLIKAEDVIAKVTDA